MESEYFRHQVFKKRHGQSVIAHSPSPITHANSGTAPYKWNVLWRKTGWAYKNTKIGQFWIITKNYRFFISLSNILGQSQRLLWLQKEKNIGRKLSSSQVRCCTEERWDQKNRLLILKIWLWRTDRLAGEHMSFAFYGTENDTCFPFDEIQMRKCRRHIKNIDIGVTGSRQNYDWWKIYQIEAVTIWRVTGSMTTV